MGAAMDAHAGAGLGDAAPVDNARTKGGGSGSGGEGVMSSPEG